MTTTHADTVLRHWLRADPSGPSSWILPSVVQHARSHPQRQSLALRLRSIFGQRARPDVGRVLRLGAVAALAALVLGVSGVLLGGGPIPLLAPTPTPTVTEPTGPSLVPAVSCPSESDPGTPGPADQERPDLSSVLPMAVFDRDSGLVVVVNSLDGRVWTFDVCRNTWQRAATILPALPFAAAYDPVADVVVLFGDPVMAYDVDADQIVERGSSPLHHDNAHVVYRTTTGEMIVRFDGPARLFSYDPATDAWQELDQPGHVPTGSAGADLLAFDRSVDRLILYRAIQETRETFEYDFAIPSWFRAQITTPQLDLVWGDLGRYEIAFDEANARTVVFSSGRVLAYDARAQRWEIVFDSPPRYESTTADEPAHRGAVSLVYDPVNERLIALGGRRASVAGWFDADDVVAFDLATGEWIQLLAPSAEATPVIPWS